MKRILLGTALLAGLTACQQRKEAPLVIPTDKAMPRDIDVTADATGKIEPINVVDIKSKAGGLILRMPLIETGRHVTKGDTIVDLDKRDVISALDQAKADLVSAQAQLDNSIKLRDQNLQLVKEGVITRRDMDASELDVKTRTSSVVRSQQAKELADQRVADATILAPQDGTILDKIVSEGTVIASASNSASGGTTLVKMADLNRVRARVLVSETDIGKVEINMVASVLVDAFPNRPFMGIVEKMEPQAVVDQNVTMFPVMVSLANEEGALMPGMNGEVNIQIESKKKVLSIPLDAFRLTQEAGAVAEMFGVTKEQVDSVARAGQMRRPNPIADDSATRARNGGGDPGDPASGRGAPANDGGRGGANGRSGGNPGGAGGNRNGGRPGGAPQPQDPACQAITDKLTKAGVQQELTDLSTQMADPSADRTALMTKRNDLLKKASVDEQAYSGCRRRMMAVAGSQAAGGAGGRGGRGGGRGGRGGGRGGGGAAAGGNLGQRNGGLGVRGQGLAQAGIVFVRTGMDTTVKPPKMIFEPRYVKLGSQNYDFAEVTEGLENGDVVALLAAAKIEIQRKQAAEKQKANSSIIPGMGGGAAGGRGMGGAPGGGGPPGGGAGGGGGGGGGRGGRGG